MRAPRLATVCAPVLLLVACALPAPERTDGVPDAPRSVLPLPEPVAQPAPPVRQPFPPPAPEAAQMPAPVASPEAEPAKPEYQLLDQGLASWYGPGLHGRRTASGERFDRMGFTAAHRTLPFGTKVCVRSLVTGKTVMVRINDRGPFADAGDRVVDLSQAAAQELGMIGLGIKPVELWQVNDDGEDCVPALGGDRPLLVTGHQPVGAAAAPAASGTAPLGLKATSLGLKRKSK